MGRKRVLLALLLLLLPLLLLRLLLWLCVVFIRSFTRPKPELIDRMHSQYERSAHQNLAAQCNFSNRFHDFSTFLFSISFSVSLTYIIHIDVISVYFLALCNETIICRKKISSFVPSKFHKISTLCHENGEILSDFMK